MAHSGSGTYLPLNPGSRPRPITAEDLNGNNRLQQTSFFMPPGQDEDCSEPDQTCFTNGSNKHNTNSPTVSRRECENLDTTDNGIGDPICPTNQNLIHILIHHKQGYNPVTFFSMAYFCAAFMFLLVINIPVLPNLFYPTIGNLLPLSILHKDPRRVVVLIVLWGMHFVRRFGEVLLVHTYKRGISLLEVIGSVVYYSLFGFWIAWSINYNIDYLTPPSYIFLPGICLYVVGATGNFICHLQLRAMRKGKRRKVSDMVEDPVSKHVIPYGGCFNLVSCPHYLFEIVTWLGFALATFTLAAWMFFLVGLMTLVVYAIKRHNAYKSVFYGRNAMPTYPQSRKRLIPYIF